VRSRPRTVGSYCKNPPKTRFKNLWNWLIVLVPATVWQILNVKLRQPETEVMRISWNHLGRAYVLAEFWHLEPLCLELPDTTQRNNSSMDKKTSRYYYYLLHDEKTQTTTLFFPTCNWNCIPNSIMLHLISRRSHKLKKKLCIIAIWHNNYSKCSSFLPTRCKYTCRILLNQFILFLTCSRHRNLQNIRILQVSCYDFFAWSKVVRIDPESCNLF